MNEPQTPYYFSSLFVQHNTIHTYIRQSTTLYKFFASFKVGCICDKLLTNETDVRCNMDCQPLHPRVHVCQESKEAAANMLFTYTIPCVCVCVCVCVRELYLADRRLHLTLNLSANKNNM